MKTSDKGIALIKKHEGLMTKAYLCPGGIWTCGYGHTLGVKEGGTCTEKQATDWLREDVAQAERVINRELPGKLKQNQFDALVSFVFNIGVGAFVRSTLLKLAKQNTYSPGIFEEFQRWNKGGGKVLPGLVLRRRDEADMYFNFN